MRKIFMPLFALALLASCGNKDAKVASASTPVKPDPAAVQKAWQEYMTPGSMHQLMQSWNGEWRAELTSWEYPEAEPVKAVLKTFTESLYGGLYQQSSHKGDFMGMLFEGRSTTAYDNAKKKFISTWIDNMGTGIMIMEGDWNEQNKTLTSTGKSVDPVQGKEVEIREVITIIDDSHHKVEMFRKNYDGKEFRSMEILMTKAN